MRIHAVIFILGLAAGATAAAPEDSETVVVRPADSGAALVNPGMGWVFHHYDNNIKRYGLDLAPSDTVDEFPGASVIYLRLAWSYLEPEEGKFNWSAVDTPAQRWIDKGWQVAFRFSCAESDRDQPYATPEWVRKAGAKGYNFTPRKGIVDSSPMWEPDYDDPVFLAKLDRFLAAAAARYDGNPEVAFIDIGSFGVWGEGHTYATTILPYSAATIRRHLDLHRTHFKKTLLAANDDLANQGRGLEVMEYAAKLGMTLRDDSILVAPGARAWHHAYLAPLFWPQAPVVLESEHYGPSRDRGYWQDGSLYLKAVEEHHASYATVHWYPREFLKEMRPLIDGINLRLGYRVQLREASWPREAATTSPFVFRYSLRYAGVAPCLPGGFPAITLKDDKGGIVAVFVDESYDVRALPVGPPDQAEAIRGAAQFRFPPPPIFRPGAYDLYFSVGTRTGTPRIALPLGDDDGKRRYRLGAIAIR
ncbi:MAG: beta-galactosidase [Bryobacteraceae bacterium]|nr:beta-galactosidase [Bryobacteraceae bacterium]